jgi:methionyl-tRNA synthetase
MPDNVTAALDQLLIPQALTEIFKAIQRANKYIDETAPWVLAKDEANRPRLAQVLYNLCETLRRTATLLQPFMPDTAPKMAAQLGLDAAALRYDALNDAPATYTVHKGEALFPRIDVAKELAELEAAQAAAAEPAEKPAESAAPAEGVAIEHLPEITIDDFCKCELRVARVLTCEQLKESKKLLKLTLFDGERERTILSGISKWYAPADLIGKNVGIVANLAPRPMLKGKYVSEGMVMAADTADGGASVVFFPDDVQPGSAIH